VQPCPFCRALMYFHEHQETGGAPAWMCSCGYRIAVDKPSVEERQRTLAERRAKLFRKSMVVRARAARLRKASSRLNPRGRGKK